MPVIQNSEIETFELPGIAHQTVAGHQQALRTMEVWIQTIAPGAATPVHRHACEEVIVILSGSGACTIEGETTPFGADSTLIVPADVVHQIVNTSTEEMKLVAALGTAPVRVKTADNEPLPVPWEAPSRAHD